MLDGRTPGSSHYRLIILLYIFVSNRSLSEVLHFGLNILFLILSVRALSHLCDHLDSFLYLSKLMLVVPKLGSKCMYFRGS